MTEKAMNSEPPDLPVTQPPDLPRSNNEKWLLEDDIEVSQLIVHQDPEEEEQDLTSTTSRFRLEADLLLPEDQETASSSNLLQPTRVPKRRRSPITVQEWVASLPIHHIVQREHLESGSDSLSGPQLTVTEANESMTPLEKVAPTDGMDTLDIEPCTYEGFRRLSASLEEMEEKANDSQSEDEDDKFESAGGSSDRVEEAKNHDDEDSIQLGEEASLLYSKDPSVPLKQANFLSLADRRRLLLQSHQDYTSFKSDFSLRSTVSSVDSVLMSRSVDPSELLLDLGFGGPSTSILARIPTRFFAKSHAKGISVESFLRSQEELVEKFDSGFSGYRGLSGPPDSRPSKLVEKIIERIRLQERFKRQTTGLSLTSSVWKSPKPKGKSGFVNIVNRAMEMQNGLKGARAFRAAVQSVLSPANREYMAEQARRADRSANERIKKKLVIGGKTFSIDEDDLSVVDEDVEKKELPPVNLPDSKPKKKLSKRDSSMSILSSCSVESDWSDEELEELEKMFGSIQHKSSMAEKPSSPVIADNTAENKWRNLKKSKRLAMSKIQQQKSLRSSLSSSSTEAELIFSRTTKKEETETLAKADDRVPRRFSQQTKRV